MAAPNQSEKIVRADRIAERLLDEAELAAYRRDWRMTLEYAQLAASFNAASADATALKAAAEKALAPGSPAFDNRDVTVVRSAGGLVWKRTARGSRLAVIHRPAQNDWTLPKGKLEPREDWQAAAIREVNEETGSKARIEDLAGSIAYNDAAGRSKIVLFYNMGVTHEATFVPSDEVDQLAWLSPREAAKLLTHPQEAKLVAERTTGNALDRRAGGLARWLLSRMSLQHPNLERLDATLTAFHRTLDRRIEAAARDAPPDQLGWATAAIRLLADAEQARSDGNADRGWRLFNEARRTAFDGLDPDELRAEALGIVHEANEKLRGWRANVVNATLTATSTNAEPSFVLPDQLAAARAILDEHFNNIFLKVSVLRFQLFFLFVPLTIVIGLLALLVSRGWTSDAGVLDSGEAFNTVALLGALGGTLSAIISTARSSAGSKVPNVVGSVPAVLVRPLLGAASALAVAVILEAQIVDWLTFDQEQRIGVSVVAGFSEQILIRAVSALAEPDPKATP